MIRPAMPQDAAALCTIYNHYIVNSVITFEEVTVAESEFATRIANVQDAGLPWLVAEDAGTAVGYAYAVAWKERSAYRFSVEASVYLAHTYTGKGWGTRLYDALFVELRKTQVHVVIGGIALPNAASVALHEKMGMKTVAMFPEVGFKFGRWIDVGYWQVELGKSA
ncbi:MAG: Phosphinothricin N-acetyltransferase [Pseudomonadota bacterium]|jgi:phosphinothricin acetyltransferase